MISRDQCLSYRQIVSAFFVKLHPYQLVILSGWIQPTESSEKEEQGAEDDQKITEERRPAVDRGKTSYGRVTFASLSLDCTTKMTA